MFGFHQNERVIMVVRRHWFLFALDASLLGFFAIAPLLLSLFIPRSAFESLAISGNAFELALFIYSLWLLLLWVALFIRWTDYYLDLWVITDRRVVDVEQRGLFSREVVTANLERVQNVTIDSRGLFATLLHFGDVRIETAGAETNHITIRSAKDPEKVKERILRALESLSSKAA